MTRKEMRKQQKKNRVVNNTSSGDEISKIIKIISAIAVCFALVYFGTSYITGRMSDKEEEQEVEIQYNNIDEEIEIKEAFIDEVYNKLEQNGALQSKKWIEDRAYESYLRILKAKELKTIGNKAGR